MSFTAMLLATILQNDTRDPIVGFTPHYVKENDSRFGAGCSYSHCDRADQPTDDGCKGGQDDIDRIERLNLYLFTSDNLLTLLTYFSKSSTMDATRLTQQKCTTTSAEASVSDV